MKKIVYTLAGIMLTGTLMSGCSANATSTQNNQAQSNKSSSAENGGAKQRNFQKIDLEGEVTSIDGNKITLKVIKVPERPQGSNQKDNSGDGNKQNTQNNNKDGQAQKGQGQHPKGQGNRQVEYTGETKDITISDGVQIKSMGRGQQDSGSNTSLKDIKVGDVLMVTYSDESKETISNIIDRPAVNQNEESNTKQ